MLSILFGIFFISFQSRSSLRSFKEAEKPTQKSLDNILQNLMTDLGLIKGNYIHVDTETKKDKNFF